MGTGQLRIVILRNKEKIANGAVILQDPDNLTLSISETVDQQVSLCNNGRYYIPDATASALNDKFLFGLTVAR